MEDGDDTQSFLNSPLPTLKSNSRSKGMLAEGSENASALPRGLTVAAPAGFVSKGSGLSNSVAGAVTLAIRAASSAVRGITFRCGASRSDAAAKTVVAAVAKKSWIK